MAPPYFSPTYAPGPREDELPEEFPGIEKSNALPPSRILEPGGRPEEPSRSMRQADSEQRAWEVAMRHRRWLLEQATLICRNPSDAEDLTQDTLVQFVKASASVKALPSDRSCRSWMNKTLRNLFTDYCRKRQVQKNGSQDPTMRGETMATPEPLVPSEHDSIPDEEIKEAVAELKPEARLTFELHAEGKSYREIAQEQGIKVGTVGKRLHDARKRMYARFQKYLASRKN